MAPLLRYLKHNKSISLLANHFCSYVSLPLYLFDSFLLSTLHLQNKCFWFLWWINNAYIQVYITCLGLGTKNQFMSWILMIDIKTVSYAYTVTNILGPKLCLATNKLFLQVAMTSVFSVFLPRLSVSLFSSSNKHFGNCLPPQRLFLLWLSVCSSTFLHFLHLYMFFYGFSLWNLCHLSMVSFLQFFHGEFSAFYGWFLVVKFFRFLKLNFCICFVVFFMNLCLSCSFFLFFYIN